MRVVIGGTFDHLHQGHIAMLKKAFSLGNYVYIGLTTDAYVKKLKKGKIENYAKRRKKLEETVEKFGKKFEIMPLKDRFGPSTTVDFDVIVVTVETYRVALQINKIRKENRLKPLKIVRIKYVLAKDHLPISSSRIRNKEVDKKGNLRG